MSRNLVIWAFGLQIFCALYFVVDILFDLKGWDEGVRGKFHFYSEMFSATALICGVFLGMMAIRALVQEKRRLEENIRMASGAFQEVLDSRFRQWNLSPAEAEVALFAIKGLSLDEIASVRGTSTGTIKAQSNAVYRKAGVNSRAELLGLFVESLFEEPLLETGKPE